MTDIVGEGILEGDAVAAALNGELQVVCQNKGQVGIQFTVQLFQGFLDDVVGCQQQIFGQVPE